jgi:hypothetical protein
LQKNSKEVENLNISNESVLYDTDLMSYVSVLKEDKFEKNAAISLSKALKDTGDDIPLAGLILQIISKIHFKKNISWTRRSV